MIFADFLDSMCWVFRRELMEGKEYESFRLTWKPESGKEKNREEMKI